MEINDPYKFCTVKGCNRPADGHHIKPRSVLPKKEWTNPKYLVNLCRVHHTEIHQIGPVAFCKKHDYPELLKRYQELNFRV